MDCFFISVLCGLFYFCVFNDRIIIFTKMKRYYLSPSYSKFFRSKTKIQFHLTIEKTYVKVSKTAALSY